MIEVPIRGRRELQGTEANVVKGLAAFQKSKKTVYQIIFLEIDPEGLWFPSQPLPNCAALNSALKLARENEFLFEKCTNSEISSSCWRKTYICMTQRIFRFIKPWTGLSTSEVLLMCHGKSLLRPLCFRELCHERWTLYQNPLAWRIRHVLPSTETHVAVQLHTYRNIVFENVFLPLPSGLYHRISMYHFLSLLVHRFISYMDWVTTKVE